VPTASGDSPDYVANFYRAFFGHHDCEQSDLGLFERTVADPRMSCCARRGSRACLREAVCTEEGSTAYRVAPDGETALARGCCEGVRSHL
jgi:hypothetical protein